MSGLEQTFYIMAIIYMGLMFIIMIAAVAAIFAIKAKVNEIHDKIEQKLSPVAAAVHAGEKIAKAAKAVLRKN
jgi:cell division protein FtsL